MKCSKIVSKTPNGRFIVVSQPACQVTSRSLVVMLAEVMRKQAVACGRQSDLNSATQTVESDLGRSLHHNIRLMNYAWQLHVTLLWRIGT